MSFTGFEPGSDSGPTDSLEQASPPRSDHMWRSRTVVIVGAVAALVIGSAATGIAISSQSPAVNSQSASRAGSAITAPGTSASLLPRGGSSVRLPGGSASGFSRASEPASATPASAAQAVGVVLINTVLKYQAAEAAGTGIVVTSTGEILTNNHVVAGATSISVTIASSGKTYSADVVGTDATRDIAVLSLEGASGLATAAMNRSADAAVGDAVAAVGNAGGTGYLSAASGTVTALSRTITASGDSSGSAETLNGLIETNADVVAGDSGGPLYDGAGKVIGIDTAASSGSSAVTGYAIPITTALAIVKQIESGVESAQITIGYPAFLGVEVAQSVAGSVTAGATVAGVLAATPAAAVGIVAGDTITSVDSTAITSPSQLTNVLQKYAPGTSVTIGWTDPAGRPHSATVVLIAGAAN